MSERKQLETGTNDLLGWVENGIAVLSFNRPERRNALSDDMYVGFGRALPLIAARSDIGCLVITGEGGAFCAGGDVKGFAEGNAAAAAGKVSTTTFETRVDGLRRLQAQVSLAIHQMPKVTVAVLPGATAGAGLSIALACDLRIVNEKAKITTAFSKIGASGDFGGSWFMTQLIGASRAKQLYVLSEILTARQAELYGLVNVVLADDGFDQAWRVVVQKIASGPTMAYRYIKENINRASSGASLATCLDAEAVAMVTTMLSSDHKEAVIAFVEKRDATFAGH
jgi:2-(1,2-epoxy-1,2-dihydrophenyl)acetyl-CoA isomerase